MRQRQSLPGIGATTSGIFQIRVNDYALYELTQSLLWVSPFLLNPSVISTISIFVYFLYYLRYYKFPMIILRRISLMFLGLILLALLINKISYKFIFDRTSFETPPGFSVPFRSTILPFLNYDGRNYLNTVLYGYTGNNKGLAFFPLYPLLIRILSLNLTINPIIIGLLVSLLSSVTAAYFFYKLVKLDYSEKIAKKSLILLLFFPSSIYFFSYYPEGLFLLFVILFFWFLKKGDILFASVFVSIATATRLIGLSLIPVLIYEGFLYFRKTKKIPWVILISPLGFLSFALFIFIKFGNFFYIISAQTNQNFGRTLQILNPFLAFVNSTQRVLAGPQSSFDNMFVYPVIILELMLGIFELIILFLSFKKIDIRYWIYLFCSVLIVLSSGVLSANVRNLLVVFPIFIFLGFSLKRKAYYIWLTVSLILLVFVNLLFLKGYWIA